MTMLVMLRILNTWGMENDKGDVDLSLQWSVSLFGKLSDFVVWLDFPGPMLGMPPERDHSWSGCKMGKDQFSHNRGHKRLPNCYLQIASKTLNDSKSLLWAHLLIPFALDCTKLTRMSSLLMKDKKNKNMLEQICHFQMQCICTRPLGGLLRNP